MSLRIMIVGYGRMGKTVDRLCGSQGCEVVERLDIHNNAGGEGIDAARLPQTDVAIDFSTAEAVLTNLPRLAAAGINAVVGTTGWNAHEERMKAIVAEAGIGVVAAANFSLGGECIPGNRRARRPAAEAARRNSAPAFTRRTTPPRLMPRRARRWRCGTRCAAPDTTRPSTWRRHASDSCPGTHTVGFDGPFEALSLTHATRDRATFAHGAIAAARWVHGRRGWFSMRDVLGLER